MNPALHTLAEQFPRVLQCHLERIEAKDGLLQALSFTGKSSRNRAASGSTKVRLVETRCSLPGRTGSTRRSAFARVDANASADGRADADRS